MAYKGSVIVTGGTVGLGYETALAIARQRPDYLVVIASRSDKDHAADSINRANNQKNTRFQHLDLSDPSNVRAFAKSWLADTSLPPVKALVLNAALQFPGALTLTPEGVEKTFAITHLGHALLFHLLAPTLAADARIVTTASGTHDPAQKTGMPPAEYNSAADLAFPPRDKVDIPGRARYTSAKLCNVLWTYALHRRLAAHNSAHGTAMTATTMCPGLMPGTGLAREASGVERFLWSRVLPHLLPLLRWVMGSTNVHTPAESGANMAMLAVGGEMEGVSGKYFESGKEAKSSVDSHDQAKQDDLWTWTVDYCAGGDAEEKAKFEKFQ
ncbi:dehydrogenase/reductase [Microdochium bolleyi]|uniref:Dehydrogenase/reductase n=1 Tax=Microdochium bolleyi TaxID=196109 RepID=A0A136IRL8_9PEZI|nr:dehydrogenase/reductase [Microdochium bolleyi]